MRNLLVRMCLLSAAAATAFGQNSDLGLLVGVAHLATGSVTTTGTSGSVSASGQINYAIQLHESPGGRFYLELPLIITGNSAGSVSGGVATGLSETIFFFTPGVRWKFNPASRVSLYAAGGLGFVAISKAQGVAGGGVAYGEDRVGATGAANVGIGLDFRLTRLVSLRADAREVPTFATVRGSYHHEFLMFGVGLHF
jgi:hypothetical protein